MTRLFFLIFSIAGVTGAGMAVVATLVLGHDSVAGLLTWAASGTVLGSIASWVIARQLLAT